MLLAVALLLYSFIDCASADARRVRNLPKAAWFLVILMPIVGPLAWLFAGRPPRESQSWPLRPGSRPEQPRTLAPEDDPAFLEALRRRKAEMCIRDRATSRRLSGTGGAKQLARSPGGLQRYRSADPVWS